MSNVFANLSVNASANLTHGTTNYIYVAFFVRLKLPTLIEIPAYKYVLLPCIMLNFQRSLENVQTTDTHTPNPRYC